MIAGPNKNFHLTYCSNIHPGESWAEVFANLQTYIPPLKAEFAAKQPFGIGLRLSNQAAIELCKPGALVEFRSWLNESGTYVFTMNGFPYGGFHRRVVKESVYAPDWRTEERVAYTIRLAHILNAVLPEGIDGGISTSPISYKYWMKDAGEAGKALRIGADNLARVAAELVRIERAGGKYIHIDIEPEPDCLLENCDESIEFFTHHLYRRGADALAAELGIPRIEAEDLMRRHITLCYDICHFAVEFEHPRKSLQRLWAAGIKIGKFQISAAMRTNIPVAPDERKALGSHLERFVESTYLHQVVERYPDGKVKQYRDLDQALPTLMQSKASEWRFHFHVPIFVDDYGMLRSTREDIEQTLLEVRQQHSPNHLEIETYTWEVLPDSLKMDIGESIRREYEWVLEQIM